MTTPDRFQLEAEMNAPLQGRRKYPRTLRRKGYAGVPGTGPAGETCKSCANLARVQQSKTYLKCELMRRFWSGGYGTDVKASSPACKFWKKPEADNVAR